MVLSGAGAVLLFDGSPMRLYGEEMVGGDESVIAKVAKLYDFDL